MSTHSMFVCTSKNKNKTKNTFQLKKFGENVGSWFSLVEKKSLFFVFRIHQTCLSEVIVMMTQSMCSKAKLYSAFTFCLTFMLDDALL